MVDVETFQEDSSKENILIPALAYVQQIIADTANQLSIGMPMLAIEIVN